MPLEVTKIPPSRNKHTKLSREDAYNMEVEALCRLENTYECICETKKTHFPTLIRTDSKIYKLVMSHRGKSLNDKETRQQVIEYCKNNYDEFRKQAYCIVNNMLVSGVKHVDCPTSGQNICWDEENKVLSLIDFNICHIGKDSGNKVINSWKKSYGKTDKEYAMNFFRQIMYIARYEE